MSASAERARKMDNELLFLEHLLALLERCPSNRAAECRVVSMKAECFKAAYSFNTHYEELQTLLAQQLFSDC